MPYILKLGRFWVLIAFLVICIFFSLNNQEPISVNLSPLLQGDLTVAAYRVYFSSFLFGATLAIVFFGYENIRKTMEIRKLRKKLRNLESQSTSKSSGHQSFSDIAPLPQ